MSDTNEYPREPLKVLERIRERTVARRPRPGEVCELCGEPIPDEHGHLADLKSRNLLCACRPCYLLFQAKGAGGSHYQAVPDRFLYFEDFSLSAAQWDSLQIPVSTAFFFVNSELDRVAAFYPSPAGATESLLSLDTWQDVVDANPELATILPDVEAFLVHKDRAGQNPQCFLVPIDACYELVGEMRRLWRGFDGGKEANEAMDAFFHRVRAKAKRP
ncbi:MAG TPA: DUF5947 family protein [Acidimicrobiales bacterium]|jgi:hypothetical protein|nr:DUF5947 family protein [Acidimicrobiales bacterium]